MLSLYRLTCSFCLQPSVQSLKPFLSPHILNLLHLDHQQQQGKFGNCLRYMHQAAKLQGGPEKTEETGKTEKRVKTQCNLIFNSHCLGDSLTHLSPTLSSLVLNGSLSSQS